MNDVFIGEGELDGQGVYAARDFKEGEAVVQYSLKALSEEEYAALPEGEQTFVHTQRGQKYLYGEPERYVNHSDTPNTYQDLERQCDVALRDITKGEMVTTDATKDDVK